MSEKERTREKKNSTEEPNKAPISNTKHIFSEAHLWLIHSGCVTELSFIDVKIKRRRRSSGGSLSQRSVLQKSQLRQNLQ